MDFELPRPTEEQRLHHELMALRQMRAAYIAQTDWTQLPDNGLNAEQVAAWQQYRQRLRDVTDHFKNLDEVEWPELGQEVWPTPPAPPYEPGT